MVNRIGEWGGNGFVFLGTPDLHEALRKVFLLIRCFAMIRDSGHDPLNPHPIINGSGMSAVLLIATVIAGFVRLEEKLNNHRLRGCPASGLH